MHYLISIRKIRQCQFIIRFFFLSTYLLSDGLFHQQSGKSYLCKFMKTRKSTHWKISIEKRITEHVLMWKETPFCDGVDHFQMESIFHF